MTDDDVLDTGVPVARRSTADMIFGIAVVVLAAGFALWAIPVSVRVPDTVEAPPLSPAFLPYVLTGLIGIMGLVCIVQATLGQGVPKESSELTFVARPDWPVRLAMVLGAFAALWLLSEPVGMLPVSVLVMGALVFAGGERNLTRGFLVSVVLPVAIWLFFTRVAQVPLPEGILEGVIPS